MSAVAKKAITDLRRRKLQTAVIGFVVALSSGAGAMALSLLIETDAPFDHAFASQQGAHLTMFFDPARASLAQVATTAGAPDVAAAAGPWRQVGTTLESQGRVLGPTSLTGRDDPNGPVDRLTMLAGRWLQGTGEVVLERHLAVDTGIQVGETITAVDAPNRPQLRVVGIAVSIEREQAWVSSSQAVRLVAARTSAPGSGKGPLADASPVQLVMDYRLHAAATNADVVAAEGQISRMLPSRSVVGEGNWLDVKHQADLLSNVMVPFLLAFSALALVASALIIANVVTGVVIAGYREIGIMKSLGFTPVQVMAVLAAETLAPALAGCAVGLPLGTLASQPFLQDTANALGIPLPFTWSAGILAAIVAAVLLVSGLAALFPAMRAARLSAAAAITAGSAPRSAAPARLSGMLARLRLPRPLTMGAGESFARPVRSGITLLAILFGVATVTFALGLHNSLALVKESISRAEAVPVLVSTSPQPDKGSAATPPIDPETILRGQPGLANLVAEADVDVAIPGIATPSRLRGFRGTSSSLGYALIDGRWFATADEVVVQSAFLDDNHLRVGDTFSAGRQAVAVSLRIVGTYVDNRQSDYTFLGDWSMLTRLNPTASPTWWEVQVRPGISPQAYVDSVGPQLEAAGYGVDTRAGRGIDDSFMLLNLVIVALAAVLTLIAIAGVFNTVLLNTRERVRETAILRAVGMGPGQVVVMVVAGVSLLGVAGGVIGIPLGLATHHAILGQMGHIAGTDLPAAFYNALGSSWLPLLAASGLVVAALGAIVPAAWASRVALSEVLHSE